MKIQAGMLLLILTAGNMETFRGLPVMRMRGGRTVRFDSGVALRAAEELERRLASVHLSGNDFRRPSEAPGLRLPVCKTPSVNRRTFRTHPTLYGKTLLWTRTGGDADVVIRTDRSSWEEMARRGELPDDGRLAGIWGVRCVPTRIRILSGDEIEIREGE